MVVRKSKKEEAERRRRDSREYLSRDYSDIKAKEPDFN